MSEVMLPIHRQFEQKYGVASRPFYIDVARFREFQRDFLPYMERHQEINGAIPKKEGVQHWNYDWPSTEKQLEYFVSLDLLQVDHTDVFMDVASCMSVFPQYVTETYHCRTFRQDWFYKDGVNGSCVGGDACAMPLPDNSVSKITLHCSFEHFEGTKDRELMEELARVLQPGGKAAIVPFYCGTEFGEEVREDYASGCQFHRYYDAPAFYERVARHLRGRLSFEFIRILNLNELREEGIYCHFALVVEKPTLWRRMMRKFHK